MSSSLKTPEPFSFAASDLASQWKLWRRQFEWYLIATRTDADEEVDEEKQVGMLITLLGSEGLKIYDTFTFPQAADAQCMIMQDKASVGQISSTL